MKTSRFFLSVIVLAAFAVGCKDETVTETPSVNTNVETLSFTAEGGADEAQSVYVTSNYDWEATCNADWVVVSPSAGSASDNAVAVSVYVDENTDAARTATITFTASTAKATVTVTQDAPVDTGSYAGEVSGSGTEDDPYSVAAALEIIGGGTYTDDYVYTKGIVSSITEIDTGTYGNATYYISYDGSETATQLYVYRGYYLGNVHFSSEDQLQVGDEVVVYGVLTLYYETPEITQYNYLYSLNGETAPEYVADENEKELVYGNDFDAEVVTSNTTITESTTCYKNETGTGIANVGYNWSSKMSVRVSTGSSGYADASGNNNIFFGTDNPGYFVIKSITLPKGETNYKLKFGATESTAFSHETFKVYVSEDNIYWVALDYTFPDGDPSSWDLASTVFTVPEGTDSLYVYYEATATSVYRIDDVQLYTYAVAGTVVDFSTGVELEGGDVPDDGEGGTHDVAWENVGSSHQTWTFANDDTYGNGWTATSDGMTVSYYLYTATTNLSDPASDSISLNNNNELVISVKGAKYITSVTIYVSNTIAKAPNMNVSDGTTATKDSSLGAYVWTGSVEVFEANLYVALGMGTAIITKIEVTYDN